MIALTFVSPSMTSASPARVVAHTKEQAELNVLRFVARSRSHQRIAELVDPRTGLLRDNVQSVCNGRGLELNGARYQRFVCVLRPWPSTVRRELHLTYRALAGGRFQMHWLVGPRR